MSFPMIWVLTYFMPTKIFYVTYFKNIIFQVINLNYKIIKVSADRRLQTSEQII